MFKDNEKARNQYEIEQKNEKIVDKEMEQISRYTTNMEELLDLTQKIRNYRAEIYKFKLELKGQLEGIYEQKDTKLLSDMETRANKDENVLYNLSVTNLIFGEDSLEKVLQSSLTQLCFPNAAVMKIFSNMVDERWLCVTEKRDDVDIYYNIGGWMVTKEFKNAIVIHDTQGDKILLGELDRTLKNVYYMNRKKEYASEENARKNQRLEEKEQFTIKRIILIRASQILQYYEKELSYWQEINLINEIENGDSEHYFE